MRIVCVAKFVFNAIGLPTEEQEQEEMKTFELFTDKCGAENTLLLRLCKYTLITG